MPMWDLMLEEFFFREVLEKGVIDGDGMISLAICLSLPLFFRRKRLRSAVNGMTWPRFSIGSGAQIVPVIKSIQAIGEGDRD